MRHTRRPSPLANNSSSSSSSSNASTSNSQNPPKSLGPLAKAESYDDDVIETPVAPTKQGISYSNLISSYGRSSSSSSSNNQSRVAISPLYCEQSVPTLQSPKNAVAPSDIIFERPPAGQTTLMSYSSSADYSNSVVQVKNALINDHARQNSHVNPVPLNLNLNLERIIDGKSKGAIKKKDIKYIDDEPTPSTSSQVLHPEIVPMLGMNRTQTVVSICPSVPDIITRSCSVGYLDNMELIPGEVTLSQLRKETPKRLVLVDRKIQPHRKYRKIANPHRQNIQQAKFKSFKKSISLDSCDLQDIPNLNKDLNNLFKQMPKLAESSENTEDTEHSSTELTTTAVKKNKLTSTPKRSPKEKICNFFSSRSGTPILGRKFRNTNPCVCSSNLCSKCSKSDENVKPSSGDGQTLTAKPPVIPKWSKKQQNDLGECSKAPREHKRNKNLEIITSFTDSPLFSRKYRASKNEFASAGTSSRPHLQSEHNTPILSRRNDNRSSSSDSGQPVEVTPIESKTSVSLHTQVGFFASSHILLIFINFLKALTTLENIISRLRDMDDERPNSQPPGSPSRHPRSSPSSPAPNKKNKRQQSSSPIRHILNSPLLNRRKCKKPPLESSDEDGNEDDNGTSSGAKSSYHDLETFQKAQLRQKVRRRRRNVMNLTANYSILLYS